MSFNLGRDQRAAATVVGAPVRVVAGAGTGKTAVIAERFRQLVAAGADPGSILVMTFTERAAGEMRERIEDVLGRPAPAVGTFHSMALNWLRSDGRSIGLRPGFRILAGAERWIVARELMWRLGDRELAGEERPDDLVGPALQMLERMKEELVPLERLRAWASSSDDRDKAGIMGACLRLFAAYEKECRRRGWLDFDDLLLWAVHMLEQDPALLARFQARYPHVLVDEYQDLNLAQERLVELIGRGRTPFVVGDDDQSIYRFRGASRASLERFVRIFPGARTITLGLNRRSPRRIVRAADVLISHNVERLSKRLISTTPGPRVELWSCADGAAEASAIATAIAELDASELSEGVAVLCRTNALATPIAKALSRLGVSHVVVGGHGFYDQPSIKDVMALLRVVLDPEDRIALARVLARPPLSIDETEALRLLRDAAGPNVLEALGRAPSIGALARLLLELGVKARSLDVRDLLFELMERSGYLPAVVRTVAPDKAELAVQHVSRFADVVADFCETTPDRSLPNFMRHLDLVLLSGEDDVSLGTEPDATASVMVMTIHQAKGLEFGTVFVPSLVEGRLPQSSRSPRFELPPAVLEPLVRGREDVIAEERRLLYVAMTRARRRLFLTCAARYEGGRTWRESRFLDEIRAAGRQTVRDLKIEACPDPAPSPPTRKARPIELSYSGITTYRDCPRQFWYRYEQHLPAPPSAEAVHGVVLHDVLRRCGELRQQGRRLSAASVRRIFDEVWRSTDFPDPRRAPTFKRIGAEQLEALRRDGGLDGVPSYLEQPFAIELEGFILKGTIDRIDRTAAGWKIIDFKTGRPAVRRRRDLQLALYSLGATRALGLAHLELEVIYLASGAHVAVGDAVTLSAAAGGEAAAVAQSVASGNFEAAPERWRCRLCPYRLACPAAL